MEELETPWGKIPIFGKAPEEYEKQLLLRHAAFSLLSGSHVLVLGLGSGVVPASLGLRKLKVTAVTDSATEQRSVLQTWISLGLEETKLVLADVLNVPTADFLAVVICRPPTLFLWDYYLQLARRFVKMGSSIFAAPPQPDGYYEWKKWIGNSKEVHEEDSVFQGIIPEGAILPWTPRHLEFPPLRTSLVLHPALDLEVPSESAAALLRFFPKPATRKKIVVWGDDCIILGIAAAKTNPQSQVWCITDSFNTIWSARESFQASDVGPQGGFLASDSLEDFDRNSVDLVLYTDKEGTHGEDIRQAFAVLKPEGELWAVLPEESLAQKSFAQEGVLAKLSGQRGSWAVYKCTRSLV